jgi:predicted secreted Zn-dependent protease
MFFYLNGRFLRFCLIAALVIGLAGWVGAAQFSHRVTVTTNFYQFKADTYQEILPALVRAMPWRATNAFHAHTDWMVAWSYEFARGADGVRLTHFKTRTEIKITLPMLVSTNMPPEPRQRWARYYHALMLHEKGHETLARAVAGEAEKRLAKLGAFESVAALKEAVEQQARLAITDQKAREVEFDRRTQHGATQGARFMVEHGHP